MEEKDNKKASGDRYYGEGHDPEARRDHPSVRAFIQFLRDLDSDESNSVANVFDPPPCNTPKSLPDCQRMVDEGEEI